MSRSPLSAPHSLAAAASGIVAGGVAGASVVRRVARTRLAAVTAAADRTRAQLEAQVAALPSPLERRRHAFADAVLERPAPPPHDPRPVCTDAVHARLAAVDLEELDRRMEPPMRTLYDQVDGVARRRLELNYTAYYALPGALERTGLHSHMPPEDVHAMARGAVAAGGDPFLADLVMDALDAAGTPLRQGGTVLDFGSSSGRVLRVIAAARRDVTAFGCDPNAEAIAWAAEHLPVARWFVSPQAPPLDLPDASLDVAYAISIWSHFAAAPARAWLAEMHRLVRPGGGLLLTTHGLDALATAGRRGLMTHDSMADAARAMLVEGHHFLDVFGEAGDWGVRDPGWGNAWMSLDWLADATRGAWDVALVRHGALDATQDVIVLRRRA